MRKTLSILLVGSLALLPSCGQSGNNIKVDSNGDSFNSGGSFFVEGSNILDGMFWQINRPIRVTFSHAIDPDSISLGSVQFRAVDPLMAGSPVTGTFEIEAGSAGRTLIFFPACPTNDANNNGAFQPGSVEYELILPTQSDSPTVLRDSEGRALSSGIQRTFYTPPISQPQFLDLTPGPPTVSDVTFPEGLNFFADPDPVVTVRFNQSIDGRASNLNTSNLSLIYADGEIGSGDENNFPANNRVPGQLVLIQNCTEAGALVEYRITGVLPPNRRLRLQMSTSFGDLIGQSNSAAVTLAEHITPTLGDVYDDVTWTETDETVDEFRDEFDNTNFLALTEPIPLPRAQVSDGFIAANFDYPGNFVSEDSDFFLASGISAEVFTDSQSVFTDSNNRQHTLQNGVLNVDDFIIESGATLRGRGTNPLVIYATGDVTIHGTLNVSGNNANWPTSLNSPQFVEGGAAGECGGGRGGDASQIGLAETPRAMDGDGPFFIVGGGGGGGEGGFNSDTSSTGITGLNATVVGGGGGGGFAVTENVSVLWTSWSAATGWRPSGVDDAGPDHIITRHTQMVPTIGVTVDNPNGNGIFGAEDGIRGAASNSLPATVEQPPIGMEDIMNDTAEDLVSTVNDPQYDPAWTTGTEPPFDFGHPTQGPDGGSAGPSVFSNDLTGLNTLNDFWGSRNMDDGSVEVGELLAPWAGSGGGGSGDSMLIETYDADGDGNQDPVITLYPVVPFQKSANNSAPGWDTYRKGAGGGGGGGQLQIMSIGMITLGTSSKILANGGIGFSGESLIYSDNGISGSGGGSGGHLILHSATGLDVSAINVGVASNEGQVVNLTAADNIQAFGGRRGWSGPNYWTSGGDDGNATFALGRGGAGANGVIQIHVPDPTTDIIWHPNSEAGITEYIDNSPSGIPTDRAEEMLGLYTAPQAYSLIPFFSSSSMVVSEWIDTGLAELRLDQPADYPKFGEALGSFGGINTANGLVLKQGPNNVRPLDDVATGATGSVTFTAYGLTIPDASTLFAAKFLRLPNLLLGYDVLPNASGTASFEIVDATYDAGSDVMVITTATSDSPMTFALDSGNPVWSVKEKFFRVDTTGQKNSLPSSASITFEFQGADELAPGTGIPGAAFDVGGETWLTDLTDLDGARFIRYRVTFEADAGGDGVDLTSPLPVIDYVKLPFVW